MPLANEVVVAAYYDSWRGCMPCIGAFTLHGDAIDWEGRGPVKARRAIPESFRCTTGSRGLEGAGHMRSGRLREQAQPVLGVLGRSSTRPCHIVASMRP